MLPLDQLAKQSLEITFRDYKEVVGAGQQQVRFVWANVGAFHICLWTFTVTEAWACSQQAGNLVEAFESVITPVNQDAGTWRGMARPGNTSAIP